MQIPSKPVPSLSRTPNSALFRGSRTESGRVENGNLKLSGAPVHPYTRALVHPCARALVHLCKPKASLPSSHLSTPLGAVFRGGWTGKRASREIGNLKLLGVPVYLCARTPVYLCKSKASMLLSPPCLPSRPPWRSGGQVNGSKGTTYPPDTDKTDGAAIRRNRISAPPRDGYFE